MNLKKIVRILREGAYKSFNYCRVMSLKMKQKTLPIEMHTKNIYKEFRKMFYNQKL